MKLKPDWIKNLHELKDKEIIRAFSKCPENLFGNGLELGAGDGYQSILLSSYISTLISTDYNIDKIKNMNTDRVIYKQCDAEKLAEYFYEKKFDIVFSSNLLEHLSNPEETLRNIHNILNDDGIMVHCLPNIFWKFSQITLYYINIFILLIEKLCEPGWIMKKVVSGDGLINRSFKQDNNPKSNKRKHMILFPPVHGMSDSHLSEFLSFTGFYWKKKFKNTGFKLTKLIRGPVCSGYGFGITVLKNILEKLGFSSIDIYVLTKEGCKSKFQEYF